MYGMGTEGGQPFGDEERNERPKYGSIKNYHNGKICYLDVVKNLLEQSNFNATKLVNVFQVELTEPELVYFKAMHMAISKYNPNLFRIFSHLLPPYRAISQDEEGKTILQLAIETCQTDIIIDIVKKLLLDKKMKISGLQTVNLFNNNFVIDLILGKYVSKGVYLRKIKTETIDFNKVKLIVCEIAENLLTVRPQMPEIFFSINFILLIHIGIAVTRNLPSNVTNQIIFNKCNGINEYFTSPDDLPNSLVKSSSTNHSIMKRFFKKVSVTFELYTNIVQNDISKISKILKALNIIYKWTDDFMPLFLAIKSESLSIVIHLVDAGARINCTDYLGVSAFHVAAACNNVSIYKYLIGGTDMNHKTLSTYSNRFPISYAIAYKNHELFNYLFQSKPNVFLYMSRESLLLTSITSNFYEAYMKLINYNIDLKKSYFLDKPQLSLDYYSLLCVAVAYGAHAICYDLLINGADINYQNSTGSSPISIAVMSKDQLMVNLLLIFNPDLELIKLYTRIFHLNPRNGFNVINDIQTIDDVQSKPDVKLKSGFKPYEIALLMVNIDVSYKRASINSLTNLTNILAYMALKDLKFHYSTYQWFGIHIGTYFEHCKLEILELKRINLENFPSINVVDILSKSPNEVKELMPDFDELDVLMQCGNISLPIYKSVIKNRADTLNKYRH